MTTEPLRLCRFRDRSGRTRLGRSRNPDSLIDITGAIAGANRLDQLLASPTLAADLDSLSDQTPAPIPLGEVTLLSPVEQQEVWAAGVTYLRSKRARMEESTFSANAYDQVYDAARPELFFKSLPDKVVPPGEPIGIRADSKWNVPEPELALVLDPGGRLTGFTVGNDVSSRDIEGENLLYLPQAKVYDRSCSLGPWVRVGASEEDARSWTIRLEIHRGSDRVFEGETSVSQIKRAFDDLITYLCRSQKFPHGAILLTGTGIVPPDHFTLQPGDSVQIDISGIGRLTNPVTSV